MLEKTKVKLTELYSGSAKGSDGKIHKMDANVSVQYDQGERLAAAHLLVRPKVSVEVGMAYGFSTLFFLDAMHEHHYGMHYAIDPFQHVYWDGIGVAAASGLGFAGGFFSKSRFKWIEERSSYALAKMRVDGLRAQFVFIDGFHTFDATLIDFCLADEILDVDGSIIVDDTWMDSIQKVIAFVEANMVHFQRTDIGHERVCGFRKTAWDSRSWHHFSPF